MEIESKPMVCGSRENQQKYDIDYNNEDKLWNKKPINWHQTVNARLRERELVVEKENRQDFSLVKIKNEFNIDDKKDKCQTQIT